MSTVASFQRACELLVGSCPVGSALRKKAEQDTSSYVRLFEQFQSQTQQQTAALRWEDIEPLTRDSNLMVDYERLAQHPAGVPSERADKVVEEQRRMLNQLVVLKLNGGLGTTMGCTGPKSVIEVANGQTFLDLIVQQIEHLNKTFGVSIPLVLMNSFNTHQDTLKVVEKYADRVDIRSFMQKALPRIVKSSLLPCVTDKWLSEHPTEEEKDCWFPPGHGDVYESLYHSPIYQDLIRQGKKLLFISNSDNLGATVDLDILRHLLQAEASFCMEVTPKTRADVKGGTLIRRRHPDGSGRHIVQLLELAQVPKERVEEFKSISKFRVFNTNNLWMNLADMGRAVESNSLQMEIIVNPKMLADGKTQVLQLEQAAGAAIQSFGSDGKAMAICVPRHRFLPVKSCADLLLVQSSVYQIQHGCLVMNEQRFARVGSTSAPAVRLGAQFKKVGDYANKLVPRGVPDMLELESLAVEGNVQFGKSVSLRGVVIILADSDLAETIQIPDNAVLENKIVRAPYRLIDF